MKTSLMALLVTCTATATFAAGYMNADTNSDGLISLAEFQAVKADMTADQFGLIDVNGDGTADKDEVAAAVAAGVLN